MDQWREGWEERRHSREGEEREGRDLWLKSGKEICLIGREKSRTQYYTDIVSEKEDMGRRGS